MKNKDKLRYWQEQAADAQAFYETELKKMDRRESLYRGDPTLKPVTEEEIQKEWKGAPPKKAPHVWNIIAENIETEVSSTIPMPKVTARRPQDAWRAKLVEDMLRNEMDRLPMEELNDMAERTCPIQGGVFYHVEWESADRGNGTIGDAAVSVLHPKQVIPQKGVVAGMDDMDYIILKLPQTKQYLERRFGVDLGNETETDPNLRGMDQAVSDEMVDWYIVYYWSESGAVGRYSYVGDTELEDYPDYQALNLRWCAKCGAQEEPELWALEAPTTDGTRPEGEGKPPEKDVCSYCGGTKWETRPAKEQTLYLTREQLARAGVRAEGPEPGEEEFAARMNQTEDLGIPIKAPVYKPNVLPVILQKNVSIYGQLLGDSDADKIEDQQNTLNRLEKKIIDRICKAGSRVTLPAGVDKPMDEEDGGVWYLENAADRSMIGVYEFTGNLEYEMAYAADVYNQARYILGITDSFQGRQDTTATSGKAKEFAASQSAGRLESKRVMKEAAYQRLFETIFKFKLAYAAEPRSVVATGSNHKLRYELFDRRDFLERDPDGGYHWIDDFIFACDTSTPLANNRQAMWQEERELFTTGAYGDPADPEVQLQFWATMADLQYPGAEAKKTFLEERVRRQKEQERMQAMAQQAAQMARNDVAAQAAGQGADVDQLAYQAAQETVAANQQKQAETAEGGQAWADQTAE